jgi:hypothetical protein
MGRLTYESHDRLIVDDRTLAHLQVVIGDKLRRRESFLMTWRDTLENGGGRTTVWVHPRASLVFSFERRQASPLNRDWIAALSDAAHSPSGLRLVAEPESAG